MEMLIWLGIIVALLHSAMFSGMNLGFFGLSLMRLEALAEAKNESAIRILELRRDAHLLLATILWANVSSNVLLTLFTDSIMTGVAAFLFSTFGITLFGEIFPQAYLSRHILKVSALLIPFIKFYRTVFYPIAKPTAMLLDKWLGREKVSYFNEKEIKIILERHSLSELTDLARLETMGAINFLTLDDINVEEEGETINPKSVVELPHDNGRPVFPDFERDPEDPFLQKLNASKEKWVVFVDANKQPSLVMNADQFLRDVIYEKEVKSIYIYCHRPIVVMNPGTKLGEVMLKFKVRAEHSEDDVVDNDLILYWGKSKKILTGADILGRLLRGIVKRYRYKPKKKG